MKKITLLDGPVGTALWNKAERDGFKKDPVWKYNVEHPEIVAELVREYAEAGSEIILTNTFGANPPAVKRASSYDACDVGELLRPRKRCKNSKSYKKIVSAICKNTIYKR